jgi:hypothetical protein
VSDQGFIGETEARLQLVIGGRQPRKVRSLRRADRVIRSVRLEFSSSSRREL